MSGATVVTPYARGMKQTLLVGATLAGLLAVVGLGTRAEAGGVEIAVYTGPTIATYKQTLEVKSGSPQFQFAKLTVKDAPSLDASSGLSLGIAGTVFLSNSFGFEGRLDAVDIDLQSFGGNYSLDVSGGGSTSSTPVTLGTADTSLHQVRPLSLNMRLQSQGRVGIGFSGGVSYLSDIEAATSPTITVKNLNASLPVSLVATTSGSDASRHIGFNAGLTLRIRIASGFALLGEARGFAFKRSDLTWTIKETGTLTAVEKALLNSLTSQIELPRFTPGFWAARIGLSYRF